jgi:hypothetical protein
MMTKLEMSEFEKKMSGLPSRLDNHKHETKCDGDNCTTMLTPRTFNVFVTPSPEYTPLMVCHRCMHILLMKYDMKLKN